MMEAGAPESMEETEGVVQAEMARLLAEPHSIRGLGFARRGMEDETDLTPGLQLIAA